MKKTNNFRSGRHCVFNMHVHLVFVTKYRKKVFNKTAINTLNMIFSNVCEDFDAKLMEMDGENDHVHLLVEYPPKLAVFSCKQLKGCIEPPTKKTFARDGSALLERSFMVSELFCSKLRRYLHQHDQTIYPTTKFA